MPFRKRISEESLKNKKEGRYITGVSDISSDPVNGFVYPLTSDFL